MQDRHINRDKYFEELANTCSRYYIPYISTFTEISNRTKVLEIGCGDGGNLLPFAEKGCQVLGIDISESRIKVAKENFAKRNMASKFIQSNIFESKINGNFDIILVHDVIEHINQKQQLLNAISKLSHENTIIFIGFPAWQMPFGGHQQICKHKYLSKLPFIHLLPKMIYKSVLSVFKESNDCINELLSIKECGITIEDFHKLLNKTSLEKADSQFWFINPHYEIKFNLKPRKLYSAIAKVPYLRNIFSTSCFYILKKGC